MVSLRVQDPTFNRANGPQMLIDRTSGPSQGSPYCIVSPARNEAALMRRTFESVIRQSIRPTLWIIVDDGSTDDTASIASSYCQEHDWIRLLRRADRGARAVGGGVIEAFNAGLELANEVPHEFICKLDMDLDLPPHYFEKLIELMDEDPRLGTVSGKAYFPAPGNAAGDFSGPLISERIADDVSVGAS
jgi:glycosyltransferase involved in cell wall biosynthesis